MPCGVAGFLAIKAGEGDYAISSLAFGRSCAWGYCDRRHAHGAVKAPAHMPNLAVLALSSSAL